jgi:hypothetical protein
VWRCEVGNGVVAAIDALLAAVSMASGGHLVPKMLGDNRSPAKPGPFGSDALEDLPSDAFDDLASDELVDSLSGVGVFFL